jgi:hypothetical protein
LGGLYRKILVNHAVSALNNVFWKNAYTTLSVKEIAKRFVDEYDLLRRGYVGGPFVKYEVKK